MKNYRWLIVGLAFLGSMINFIDRSALSYTKVPLAAQFHINDTEFGCIAAAFGIGYAFIAPISGFVIDKYGAHRCWWLAAIALSLATMWTGAASSVAMLFMARGLLGFSEAPAFPALGKIIHEWLPGTERARALGASLVAVPFASVIGAPLISNLILYFSWQTMFFVLGFLGIAWTVIWGFLASNTPKENRFVQPQEIQLIAAGQQEDNIVPAVEGWRAFLHPALIANNYAFFTFGYTMSFALVWMPGFFQKNYGLNLQQIGEWMMIPWLVASVMVFAGGCISDYLWKRTKSSKTARSHLIWIGQLCSAASFLALVMCPPTSVAVAILYLSLGIGFAIFPNAPFYAINSDFMPKKTASSIGIMVGIYALANTCSPILTGWLTTLTGSYKVSILLLLSFSISSALMVIWLQVLRPIASANIRHLK